MTITPAFLVICDDTLQERDIVALERAIAEGHFDLRSLRWKAAVTEADGERRINLALTSETLTIIVDPRS